MSINGTPVGSYSHLGKTLTIVDSTGNEINAVIVGQETVFDATTNDVREGKVYAGEEGVKIGTKNIPSYRTEQGEYIILNGSTFSIPLKKYDQYDYTELQCIIAKYNSDESQRMAAEKVVIKGNVYAVNSSEVISIVTKNYEQKSIDFNITNNTEDIYIIYYFTYKEEI